MTLTRSEIADYIESAFEHGPAGRDDLIDTAVTNRARPDVLSTLRSLPDRRFGRLRDLWEHLPEMPVDAPAH
jgi:hypothetical protein